MYPTYHFNWNIIQECRNAARNSTGRSRKEYQHDYLRVTKQKRREAMKNTDDFETPCGTCEHYKWFRLGETKATIQCCELEYCIFDKKNNIGVHNE